MDFTYFLGPPILRNTSGAAVANTFNDKLVGRNSFFNVKYFFLSFFFFFFFQNSNIVKPLYNAERKKCTDKT